MASSPTHSSSSVSAPSHGSPPSHGEEPKNPKKSKKKTKMYVTERGKKSIEVEVQNHETIEVIKKRIMVEHNIPLRHQHLLVSVTDSRRHDRGSIFDIDKFDDAKLAGTEPSSECTLILTEGDSGKALVATPRSSQKPQEPQEQPSYFYSSSEYEAWRAKNCNENSYDIKHYKGLGTSPEEEGRKYFLEMDSHIEAFAPITEADEEAINKAFGESSKERKDWFMRITGQKESSSSQLPRPQEDQDMLPSSSDQDMLLNTTTTPSSSSQGQTSRTYKDFIDTEYISYVKANLRRTIP
ncbi:DNA topoisomerase 2 [Orobanche hederae]